MDLEISYWNRSIFIGKLTMGCRSVNLAGPKRFILEKVLTIRLQ